MSNRRGSISDYPEHLNPFYEGNEKLRFWKFGKVKRSGSFSETLRNTLTLKSFRGKKKDKQEKPSSPPELRKQAPTIPPRHRQTLPTTLSPIYSPRNSAGPALPRSRFSERVAKSSVSSEEVPNGHVPLSASPKIPATANPFEEEEKLTDLKPKRIRRRKRRAPLPPNMAREEGDDPYLGVSSRLNFSKWSLTSVETDISTYSENENLSLDAVNQEMCELMHSITKEMEKLTDDTDLNETKETNIEKTHSDIPDLIASSTEVIKRDEINLSNETTSKDEHEEEPTDENSNMVPKIICENVEEEKLENVKMNPCESSSSTEDVEKWINQNAEEELGNSNCDVSKNKSSSEEELKRELNSCDESEDADSKVECDNTTNSIAAKSDPELLYNASYTASIQDLNYNERKSLYITASSDQLDKPNSLTDDIGNNINEVSENVDINQNENVSPPMSPRCKTQVNLMLNNCAKDEDENSNDKLEAVYRPIPKSRTNKPSKSDLLGNEVTETD